MPSNWPDLTLAIALALAVAYFIADAVARLVQTTLRGVIADPAVEAAFVDRPGRVIRLTIFLVAAAALLFPAMRIAGIETAVGGSPEVLGAWLLDAGLRIASIAIAAYLIIRIGSAAARRLEREMSQGTGLDVVERTKRAQTIGRFIQKTLAIVVAAMAGLMILRELDIDITPVLTGAGIAGLAIGFGAQTLVRDVISGFFLTLEDQVRVGDVAVVNGQGGLVEQLNLRTIVLRDEAGTVHIFPNGEIKTLANMSKDFSYFVLTIGLGYDEELDEAIDAMREAAATLVDDPEFMPHILEPLEVYGIDAFEPGQLVVKGRIKTVPLKQWLVGRELRKRIARRFAERGIQMARPMMTLRMDAPAEDPASKLGNQKSKAD